jgi:phage terminase large subunit
VQYRPRPHFVAFHTRTQRWATLVCHRRAGKTVAAINEIIGRGLHSLKPNGQYAYIAPFREQAKRVAFDYLLRYTSGIRSHTNIAELSVTLLNGTRVYLFGADNPDALRGIYLDGVVIDEPAQMRPRLFSEVIRPLLADRKGWAVFIGTPAGKNEFWRIVEQAKLDPQNWYVLILKASESGILPQEELDDSAKIMSEDEYAQEYECSFDAAIKGSYYGKIVNQMGSRLGEAPFDAALPVHVSMDLGFTDSTATWIWQTLGSETRYIEAYEHSGLEIADYVDILRSKPYVYGEIWLPHDARAKSLQTGRSTIEILSLQHGIRPKIVPMLSVQQGIQAARLMLSSCWIDAVRCADGVEALRQYQREWDDEISAFKQNPKHDASSHYADSFRYSALVAHRAPVGSDRLSPPAKVAYDRTKPFGGNVQLNRLWETTRRSASARRI